MSRLVSAITDRVRRFGATLTGLLIVLLMASTGYGLIQWQAERAAHAQTKLAHATAAIRQTETAAHISTKLQRNRDRAIELSNARTSDLRRAHADARDELERLRLQLASSDPGAAADTCPAESAQAATCRAVFDDCAAQLVDMASAAGDHAEDTLTLLQAWPSPEPAP